MKFSVVLEVARLQTLDAPLESYLIAKCDSPAMTTNLALYGSAPTEAASIVSAALTALLQRMYLPRQPASIGGPHPDNSLSFPRGQTRSSLIA